LSRDQRFGDRFGPDRVAVARLLGALGARDPRNRTALRRRDRPGQAPVADTQQRPGGHAEDDQGIRAEILVAGCRSLVVTCREKTTSLYRQPSRSVAHLLLAVLPALLRVEAQGRDRSRFEALEADFLVGLLAESVAAFLDALERLVDLRDQLAVA